MPRPTTKDGASRPEHPGPREAEHWTWKEEEVAVGRKKANTKAARSQPTGGRECTGLGKVSLCSTCSIHESVQYAEHGEQ